MRESAERARDALTIFDSCRARMLGAAARIVGSREDAEDVVQEAWFRWARTDLDTVHEPSAYLTRTVSRLALDRLRRIAARHESDVDGGELGLDSAPDPAELIDVTEGVSSALVVVLESLSPLERAVFVLHEAFDFDYSEVAEMLRRTPVAIRQAAHRAREHLAVGRRRYPSGPFLRRAVAEQFIATSGDADLPSLLELLAPKSIHWAGPAEIGEPHPALTDPVSADPRRPGQRVFTPDAAPDWLRLADEFTDSLLGDLGDSPTLTSGRRAAHGVANWVHAKPEQSRVLHLLNQLDSRWPWPDQLVDRALAVRARMNEGLLRFDELIAPGSEDGRAVKLLLEIPYAAARRELATGRGRGAWAIDSSFALLGHHRHVA